MSLPRNPTRQRLIEAALELFVTFGVTETTTKQIAELAQVNEVTLFRNFGNKHGLLLAVIEDAAVYSFGQTLIQQASQTERPDQAIKDYANAFLDALERIPEVVRSLIGEAGQYPTQNREALGRGLTQVNHDLATYFLSAIQSGHLYTHLPAEKLASTLHAMLIGYAVIKFTTEFHKLWQDRSDFINNLVTLFIQDTVIDLPPSPYPPLPPSPTTELPQDLPASLVHEILQRAKKHGLLEYALMYVLFGAGLTPGEIAESERQHLQTDDDHQQLQIVTGLVRQVPLNQWIMGKRYGSHTRNPLSQWLKSRKDSQLCLFVKTDQPLSESDLRQIWQELTVDLLTPAAQPPRIEQAQQTWCIEMLSKGMNLDDLRILTGCDATTLQLYAQRVREKTAIEQAIRLDRKV